LGEFSSSVGEADYEPLVELGDLELDPLSVRLIPAGTLDANVADDGTITWSEGTERAWLIASSGNVWLVDEAGEITDLGGLADGGIAAAPALATSD
jgi:hypothetical protein